MMKRSINTLPLALCFLASGLSTLSEARPRWDRPTREIESRVNVVLDPGERLSVFYVLDLDRSACGTNLERVDVLFRTLDRFGISELSLVANDRTLLGRVVVVGNSARESFILPNRRDTLCRELFDLELVNSGRTSFEIQTVRAILDRPISDRGRRPRSDDRYEEQDYIVRCESHGHRRARCNVPGNGRVVDVRLIKKHSSAACRENRSFGADRDAIWVDQGCSGTFAVSVERERPRRDDHRDRTFVERVRCESINGRYRACSVRGTPVSVRLARQHSGNTCRVHQSFGMTRNAIWVDKGCRADFDVTLRR